MCKLYLDEAIATSRWHSSTPLSTTLKRQCQTQHDQRAKQSRTNEQRCHGLHIRVAPDQDADYTSNSVHHDAESIACRAMRTRENLRGVGVYLFNIS